MSTLTEIIKDYKSDENILIFNDGGMGKTTQMKQLHNELLKEKSGTIVPLFIDCKSLDFSKTKPVLSAILKHYCGNDCIDTMHMELLENILCREDAVYGKYKYYILIDGLNECESNKYKVIDDIASLVKGGKSRVIVSSRVDENYAVFDNFRRLKFREFNDKQIVAYLNYKKFNDNGEEVKLSLLNPDLLKILRTPMFLNLFCKTYSADRVFPDMYTKNIVKKSDLLQAFIDKVVEDKSEQHSGENNDPEYIKRKFAIERFLPALAYEMSLLEKYEISENELDAIFEKFDASYFERFETSIDQYYKRACNSSKERFLSELAYEMSLLKKHETSEEELKAGLEKIDAGYFEKLKTLIDRYYERDADLSKILNICIYELSCLKANGSYSFNHQVWQDFFCGKFFATCLNYNVTDVFETSTSESIKEFIGDIIEEYKFEDKENLNTPASPIEAFMQKHNLNSKNPITPNQTRNLIEIMKKSRNNNITADYSCLDLRKCNFTHSNLLYSKFENSEVYFSNFITMGHTWGINNISLNCNERMLVSCSDGDLILRVWDAETGLQIGELKTGHTGTVSDAVFASDEKIISGGKDGSICIWDRITGKPIRKLYSNNNGFVDCLAITSNGKVLFSGENSIRTGKSILRMWNTTEETIALSIKLPSMIRRIVLSDNEKTLCVGCTDKIYVYNITDGYQLEALSEYNANSLICLTITQDNKYILSSGWDGKISIYDIKEKCIHNKIEFHSVVYNNCTTLNTYLNEKNEFYIISTFADGNIIIWNMNTGSIVKKININGSESENNYIQCLYVFKKYNKIIYGDSSGSISISDIQTLLPITDSLEGNICADKLSVNADSQQIVGAFNDNTIRICKINKGNLYPHFLNYIKAKEAISIYFIGENVISVHRDIIFKIIKKRDGLLINNFIKVIPKYCFEDVCFNEEKNKFILINENYEECFEEDECKSNYIIQIVDMTTFAIKDEFFLNFSSYIYSTAISNDLGSVAFADDFEMKIVSFGRNNVLKTINIKRFISEQEYIACMEFMPNGEEIVLGSDCGSIYLISIKNGNLLYDSYIGDNCTCIKVIDGNRFAVGTGHGNVYIINFLYETVVQLKGNHMRFVTDLGITPDKKMIVSSSYDGTIKIWSIETGKCLYTFEKIMNANILDCDFTKVHYNGNNKEFFNRIIYQNGGIVPEEYISKTPDVEE